MRGRTRALSGESGHQELADFATGQAGVDKLALTDAGKSVLHPLTMRKPARLGSEARRRLLIRGGLGYVFYIIGSAIGWLGARFALGLIIGTALGTIVISVTSPAITWFVIAVVFAFGQWTALLLPEIEPGQQLKAVAI